MTARPLLRRPRLAALAVLPVLALAAAGCSGTDETAGPSDPSASASTSASAETSAPVEGEPYLPVPDDVELTGQGSALSLGDEAVVAYEPDQKSVGVLDITVEKVQRTTFEKSFQGWELTKQVRTATPYFVQATVANVGDSDLGGRRVPLYAVDDADVLVESSSFVSTFTPCPSTPLPKKFRNGDEEKVCLVYLVPDGGSLEAVSFRPTEDFNPITWSGPVTTVGKGSAGGQAQGAGRNGGKGSAGGGQGGGNGGNGGNG
ncbi:hypothetical protein [Nocardioides sp. P86]|uniref:hypothetical protein n=1 Tax=Nocardioides sp. P86 TaxID=2939569 RepID=UPI002042631A|nr:hypothetical protein [Nocardioides sp. P86]MCM3515534.1 hypothetical protein [Nocardioides sp. P86]